MSGKLKKINPIHFGRVISPLMTVKFWAIVLIPIIAAVAAFGAYFYFSKGSEVLEYTLNNGTYTYRCSSSNKNKTLITVPAANPKDNIIVSRIGSNAFKNFTNVQTIILPDTLEAIDENAFNGCTALTTVIIPDGVTVIGDRAFNGCKSLSNITIPNTVLTVGNSAFFGCESLANVILSSSLDMLEYRLFMNCKALTAITIPANVTQLSSETFKNCTALSSITLKNTNDSSGVSISTNTLEGCESLSRIYVQNNTVIGQYYDKAVVWTPYINLIFVEPSAP